MNEPTIRPHSAIETIAYATLALGVAFFYLALVTVILLFCLLVLFGPFIVLWVIF